MSHSLSLFWVFPFVGILLSIGLFPLLAPRFWHHHFPKISAAWALAFAAPYLYLFGEDAVHEIAHVLLADYLPFVVLIGSLFTISGGILIRGSLRGSPWVNAGILLFGAAIASWIGTTGASMLLIRPVLRANQDRRYRVHTIVFFIFVVSNIGGLLTPLGDPPLFLGFLHGVPFFWTLTNLWPQFLIAVGMLVATYLAIDLWLWHFREPAEARQPSLAREPVGVSGKVNLLLLAGVLGGVLLSGYWHPEHLQFAGIVEHGSVTVLGVHLAVQNLARDGLLVAMAGLSLWLTPRAIRQGNGFSWFPIYEVAVLFAGIFVTIIPALVILGAGTDGPLGGLIAMVRSPGAYFFVTGTLSSFLDNAPTYLTFLNTARGQFFPGMSEAEAIPLLVEQQGVILSAISVGAVFMGANTYIGNAPNFMVKAIAEEAEIRMPDFFSFILFYSLPILGSCLALIWFLFYR